MEQFLKQFSTIPHDFITDFFIIAKEYSDNEIIINFTVICKWLNVLKENLKKILVKHFEEKFDYIINKIKKKQINSNEATVYEEILITPNCFTPSHIENANFSNKYTIICLKLYILLFSNFFVCFRKSYIPFLVLII